jgi:2-methylaconitate cis-trans-isomerase PrpF
VLNNGDQVICEAENASPDAAYFTVHFRYAPPLPVRKLLLTGESQTVLRVGRERVPVSLVCTGNPYAFVDAASLGVSSVGEMFADRPDLFDRLVRIRMAAASLLGWPPRGAFPKVALIMRDDPGGVAVRALSVPSWHPSLALTGSVCLAAALKIEYTIPWLAAQAGGGAGDVADLHTPGGRWPVSVTLATGEGISHLARVTIGRRQVTCYGALRLKSPAHLQQKEIVECLTLSA